MAMVDDHGIAIEEVISYGGYFAFSRCFNR
jgi:hypothetical protein